jgi:hypothetical protein
MGHRLVREVSRACWMDSASAQSSHPSEFPRAQPFLFTSGSLSAYLDILVDSGLHHCVVHAHSRRDVASNGFIEPYSYDDESG